MRTFNFHANGVDFGNWQAENEQDAKDQFASDAGYKHWQDMLECAEEFGGNSVEFSTLQGIPRRGIAWHCRQNPKLHNNCQNREPGGNPTSFPNGKRPILFDRVPNPYY